MPPRQECELCERGDCTYSAGAQRGLAHGGDPWPCACWDPDVTPGESVLVIMQYQRCPANTEDRLRVSALGKRWVSSEEKG